VNPFRERAKFIERKYQFRRQRARSYIVRTSFNNTASVRYCAVIGTLVELDLMSILISREWCIAFIRRSVDCAKAEYRTAVKARRRSAGDDGQRRATTEETSARKVSVRKIARDRQPGGIGETLYAV